MKKKLEKDITSYEKFIGDEEAIKKDLLNEYNTTNEYIEKIEEKIKKIKKIKIVKYEDLIKLYEKLQEKNKDKRYIEINYEYLKKQNEKNEKNLKKKIETLSSQQIQNADIIDTYIKKLKDIYDLLSPRTTFYNYIISPEKMSLLKYNELNLEANVYKNIKNNINNIKLKNKKILNEIELSNNKIYKLKGSISDNNNNNTDGISTTAKNSSGKNLLKFNQKNDDNFSSSISMEIETNANIEYLINDEINNIFFIDKVKHVNSNYKPLLLKGKSLQKLNLAKPLMILKPIDYKCKDFTVQEELNNVNENIKNIKIDIETFNNKKLDNNIQFKKLYKRLKHLKRKNFILQDKINIIKQQISDLNSHHEKSDYFRIKSLFTFINNNGYNDYFENLDTSELKTNRNYDDLNI